MHVPYLQGATSADIGRLDVVLADLCTSGTHDSFTGHNSLGSDNAGLLLESIQRSHAAALSAIPPSHQQQQHHHHLVLIDDAGTLLDACGSLPHAVDALTRLHHWVRSPRDAPLAPAIHPSENGWATTSNSVVSLLLRVPAGCDWVVTGRPTQAALSLRGLLIGRSDAVLRVAPLPSGFSRDFNGRVALSVRPSLVGAARPSTAAETAGLYRITESGVDLLQSAL